MSRVAALLVFAAIAACFFRFRPDPSLPAPTVRQVPTLALVEISPSPSSVPFPAAPTPSSFLVSPTPPPTRPSALPLPLPPAPGAVTLRVDFTWPAPPATPGENGFRADLDTAFALPGLTVGPGCNDTWRTGVPVSFSGDDAFAPGRESYIYALPAGQPDRTFPPIELYAAWFRSVPTLSDSTPVTISVSARVDDAVVQSSQLVVTAPNIPIRTCAKFDTVFGGVSNATAFSLRLDVAAVNLVLQEGVPSFALTEVERPEPSAEPFAEFSAEPSSEPFPEPSEEVEPSAEPLLDPVLSLRFSWTSNLTDVEAGIGFLPNTFTTSAVGPSNTSSGDSLVKFGANCGAPAATDAFVRYSGNSFRNVGNETLTVSLGALRETGAFADGVLSISLLADWWRQYDSPESSSVVVHAMITDADGVESSKSVVEIFPGRSTGCPVRDVGSVLVAYNEITDNYSVTLTPAAAPEPDEFPSPSEEPDVEISAEPVLAPSFEPDVEPSSEPLLDVGPGLRVTFAWNNTNSDIDSSLRIGSSVSGVLCGPSVATPWALFSGDSVSTTGIERFVVLLDEARARGVWDDVVEIELSARWYFMPAFALDLATVTVERIDESGLVVDDGETQTASFNPVVERVGSSESQFFRTCFVNKVGKIRVSRKASGAIDTKLHMYARDDKI